jgi:glycosyltransferase involved in cell wall biosynthesis
MPESQRLGVKLSIIVCTKNRAQAIVPCLEAIAASLALARPIAAEIVVVDSSTDTTSEIVRAWSAGCAFPVNLIYEGRKGIVHARNTGFRAARGDLLVWTDDDCHLDASYVQNALRYDAQDQEPVLRGGRVELGDPADLPLTIKTDPAARRWSSAMRSARHECLGNCLLGCNMMMRRSLLETVGPFDARTDDDIDLVYRCYIAGIPIEYAPDLVVRHYHGRKDPADGYKLFRLYMMQMGALYAKFVFHDVDLCRPVLWDLRNAAKELVGRKNTFLPEIGFSHKHRLYYNAVGALRYLLGRPI